MWSIAAAPLFTPCPSECSVLPPVPPENPGLLWLVSFHRPEQASPKSLYESCRCFCMDNRKSGGIFLLYGIFIQCLVAHHTHVYRSKVFECKTFTCGRIIGGSLEAQYTDYEIMTSLLLRIGSPLTWLSPFCFVCHWEWSLLEILRMSNDPVSLAVCHHFCLLHFITS